MTRSLLTLALVAASLAASAQSPPAPAPPTLPEVAENLGRTLEAVRRGVEVARVASQVLDVSAAMRPGDALVLLATPDGVRAVPVTDEPVTEPAALIVHTDGAWSLRQLSPGDVPSQEALRPTRWPRPPVAPRLRTLRHGETIDRPSDMVTFAVSGRVTGTATAFLVELSETEGLESLSASSATDASASRPDGGVRVNAQFAFASMEEWAAWRARPETEALLAALGGPGGAETQLTFRRR